MSQVDGLEADRPVVTYIGTPVARSSCIARLRRRLRRVSRRLPRGDPARRAAGVGADVSVRVARHPRRRRAVDRRADLRPPRRASRCTACGRAKVSRLYLQVRRPTRTSRNWSDDRIWDELHAPRLAADGWKLDRGAGHREVDHADAQLRRRADALRPAVPRRRRGAHRPADRREGPEPRGRRRALLARGADRRTTRAGSTQRARRVLAIAACAGSGAPSTSRGG